MATSLNSFIYKDRLTSYMKWSRLVELFENLADIKMARANQKPDKLSGFQVMAQIPNHSK